MRLLLFTSTKEEASASPAGKREGLRAEEKGLEYDEFRQRIKVNQPYEWNNRQYILPIYYVDVNSNPQLVQAPGYGN